MSFEFFSAGIVLDEAPFNTEMRKGETPEAAYQRKKDTVMAHLVGFTAKQVMGKTHDATKHGFPDCEEMAVIKAQNLERWDQLEHDATADLGLNGFVAPLPELPQIIPVATPVEGVPSPRTSNETVEGKLQPAA